MHASVFCFSENQQSHALSLQLSAPSQNGSCNFSDDRYGLSPAMPVQAHKAAPDFPGLHRPQMVLFCTVFHTDILEETNKYHVSYDLWEMCEGVHLYSLASIYSAFSSILKMYDILGKDVSEFENNRLKQEKVEKSKKEIERMQLEIKKYINKYLYDEDKKSYVRNAQDKKMDISIIEPINPLTIASPPISGTGSLFIPLALG